MNKTIMKAQLDLEPLRKILDQQVDPEELAECFNELIIHYARLSLSAEEKLALFAHQDADEHIFRLKMVADALKEIGKRNNNQNP